MASLFGKVNYRSLSVLLKILDSFSEAVEVEIIADVFFVNFNKELVSLEVTEPRNPAVARVALLVVVEVVYYIFDLW